MRILHLSIPENELADMLSTLDEHDLGYTVSAGTGPQSDRAHLDVAVPPDAVEHVLESLTGTGYDREEFTASVEAEFATFPAVDAVQNRWGATPNRIAPTTLRSKAKDLRQNSRSFLWMMTLAAIVATAGLLIGSPAIVVGSMVIAPIVNPILTASVGAVRNDRDMFLGSLRQQGIGLGVAIGTAAVAAWLIRELSIATDPLALAHLDLVAVRLAPNALAIVVGLAAGAAGAYGLATTGRVTILGVMIAAALIPTAAAAGLGIAWGVPEVALGATLLVTVTVIMVNLGAVGTLLYLGYRPDEVDHGLLAWKSARDAATVIGTLVLVLAVVLAAGVGAGTQASHDRAVQGAITDVLDDEEYDALSVEDVAIEQDRPDRVDGEAVVTVSVARTDGEEYPDLPGDLERAVEERTGDRMVVQVHFVDYARADR